MGQATNLCFAALLIFYVAVATNGQVSDQQAKSIAEEATRLATDHGKTWPLRLLRREDLEDDLFRFQLTINGKLQKAAYFYEITNEGYFVLSPNERIHVSSEDGHFVKLVAVSVATGEPYLLFGFKNAALEFNRLVKEARLIISSAGDARRHVRFCFVAISDLGADRLIFSRMLLKHEVEDYFFYHYPEKKAERLYQKWWSGFSSSKLRVPFARGASKNNLGYEAKMAAITGSPQRTPLLEVWTWQISPEGFCQIKSVTTIYPRRAQP
ncbi:MAG: hypothetical protein QOD75_1497 [Blastocatellia bacterium]|jgi:hypothetical protein|nr:hypothetical protein [Blastocatellia bacterium]